MVGFAAAVAAAATIFLGAIDFGFLHPDNYPPLFVIENIPSAYGSIAFLFCVALFMFPVHSAIDKVSDFVQTFFFFTIFSFLKAEIVQPSPYCRIQCRFHLQSRIFSAGSGGVWRRS